MAKIESINKIVVTATELDIIACIIGIKKPNKIAAILDISSLTVMGHIRSLLGKFSCNSQEDIENFVQTSQELPLIMQHYIELLELYHLRRKLVEISVKMQRKDVGFCVDEVSRAALADIIDYLQIAKVKVYDKSTMLSDKQEVRLLSEKDLPDIAARKYFREVVFICKDKDLVFAVNKFRYTSILDCSSEKAFPANIFKILTFIAPDINMARYSAEFANLQKNITSLKIGPDEDNADRNAIPQKQFPTAHIVVAILGIILSFGVITSKFFIA
jgi:DNA-binding CsgD family transcriptional regulator